MPRLLALDFDGVISDSAPEAFVVAVRTYTALRPGSPIAAAAERLGPGTPRAATATGDPLYAGFLEHMPLGNRAEDYAVVLSAHETGAGVADQATYDAYRDSLAPDFLRDFHRRFYRERAALSEADPDGWFALMGPYRPFCELLRRRGKDALLAIATAKDRRSVATLLRRYAIDDLFDDGRVLDKETGVSKRAHLEHLRRELGVDFAHTTFVDDKVNHLAAVAPLGVRCALAAWGYNGPREEREARRRGFLVCRLDDAEAALFGDSA